LKNFCLIWSVVFLAAWPSTSGAIISEKLLNQAGLQTVWQNAIALNQKEKVERITVFGDYLYILTDTNYLFCLDRNTGRLNFAGSVTTLNLPVSEPAVYNNTAYLVAANNLIAIDLQQGTEAYRTHLPVSVSALVSANASYLYIPGMDKRLHVMDPNGQHEIFKASADNVSGITSVIATDSFVIFATDAGNVIGMDVNQPKRLWRQFDAVGAITAPLTISKSGLYVSSRDTNLYKLDAVSGDKIWEFHTGSALTTSARATESTVYQYAKGKGLYAVDANSGKSLWLLPDAIGLLAQDGDKAYLFDKNRTCTIMDNKLAKKIYTINFAPVTNYAVNAFDSKIYIMEGKNISCIKPIKK
jgi:outer membrane protein assembly factor BamB